MLIFSSLCGMLVMANNGLQETKERKFIVNNSSRMFQYILSSLNLRTALLALCVGLCVHWLVGRMRYKLPPGPWGLPILGNILQFDNKILHKQMYEWSLKYGSVIRLKMGPITMIVVNDITTAMEVLVKKSTDFAGRIATHSIDYFTDGQRSIAFGQYGPSWHLHRKIASKALRMYMQGEELERRVHEAVGTAIEAMEKQTGPLQPGEYITYIVGNILLGLCFGGKYSFDDKETQHLLQKRDELTDNFSGVIPEDIIPGLKYVYKSQGMKVTELFYEEVITNFIEKKYKREVETFDGNNIRHFVDYLTVARKDAEQEEDTELLGSLTEKHLIQTCADIFLAGIDTTRVTLSFTILYMLLYPEIQEKVQEEIDRVVGRDRLPGIADRPNLSYTEAVLHESMRLSTVAPIGLMHKSTCDTTINGYDIPKNTMVIINHWALHHTPDAWEDVDMFKPERFLDENGKMGPKPKNWLPFSAGKRVCLGEFVAKQELHLILASLLQRFKWRPAPGAVPDLEGKSTVHFTPKPCEVVLEKRF